jgi:hypothetical protein
VSAAHALARALDLGAATGGTDLPPLVRARITAASAGTGVRVTLPATRGTILCDWDPRPGGGWPPVGATCLLGFDDTGQAWLLAVTGWTP